jgi:hypothetical protein
MTNIQSVINKCLEELNTYKSQQTGQSASCLELFRIGVQEEDHEVFTEVYKVFQAQVKSWIYTHGGFYKTGEDIEHFVSLAFSKFYHAVHGHKFERFPNFAAVVAYLKLCTHSGIVDYLRKLPPIEANIDDIPLSEPMQPTNTTLSMIWDRIDNLLTDTNDQFVARKVFVEGYTPAELVAQFPDQFATTREVSVILQRIRRKLRNDRMLRDMFGLSDAS